MSDNWPRIPIEDLADKSRGISYGVVQPGQRVAGGIPIVRVNNMTSGRLSLEDVLTIDPQIESKHTRTRLRGGEILISLVGSVGEVAIAPAELAGWNTARAVGVIPFESADIAEWVAIFLKSKAARDLIQPLLNTTVQATLNLRDLSQIKVPMPGPTEQRAIAGVLRALDDKIEANRRISGTLEALARALFKSWFVDFDPVHAKMERRTLPLAPDLATLFPARLTESPLGPIPEGWEVKSLGQILSVVETGSRPKGGVAGIDEGVPSIGAESVVGLAQFDFEKTKFVPVEFFERLNKGQLQDRDVVLYKDGGRPGLFEPHTTLFGRGFPFETACINEHVYRLRVAPPYSQEYLYFHLTSESCEAEMRERGTGVAIPGLNSTELRALAVLQPSAIVLEQFEALVAPMVSRALESAKQSRTLAQLRNLLLPKLLSGALLVRDAERLIGDGA